MIIKGIQTESDAQELAKIGVDALVLSNHGGRQLDRSVVPLELLPKVIKLGKDTNEIAQSIVGYFDQKAVIEKAEAVKEREKREALWDQANGVKPKKTNAELTAEALEIVQKRRELEQQEYELYEMLVWSGQGKLWDDMVKTREDMRRQIAKEEAEAIKQKIIDAAKAEDRKAMIQDIQLSVAVVAGFGLLMYWLVQWGISKGMWK